MPNHPEEDVGGHARHPIGIVHLLYPQQHANEPLLWVEIPGTSVTGPRWAQGGGTNRPTRQASPRDYWWDELARHLFV